MPLSGGTVQPMIDDDARDGMPKLESQEEHKSHQEERKENAGQITTAEWSGRSLSAALSHLISSRLPFCSSPPRPLCPPFPSFPVSWSSLIPSVRDLPLHSSTVLSLVIQLAAASEESHRARLQRQLATAVGTER